MKQAIITGACIIALATLGACSNTTESSASNTPNQPASSAAPTSESPATPADLTGTWKEKNPNEDSYQIARVTADTIEIYWHTSDSDALYWAGSYVAPTDSETPYTWDSVNDTEKTRSAILASSDETKTFTYTDNTISYSVTALGITKKVVLERADIDVP